MTHPKPPHPPAASAPASAGTPRIPTPIEPVRLPWNAPLPQGFGIRLVHIDPRHRTAYKRVRGESRPLHDPWQPLRADPPDSDRTFEAQLARANTDSSQSLIASPLSDDTILGQVTVSLIRPGPPATAFAGYWTSIHHTNRHVAARALALTLDHAFTNLRLHRVEINIQPSNAPSLAVARRLRFEEEGTARKLIPIAGEWRDHTRFAMLAEDWPARRAEFARELEQTLDTRQHQGG